MSKLATKKSTVVERVVHPLFKKNKISFNTDPTGVQVILNGIGKVINRADNYEVWKLYKGDSFGECEILKTPDWSYFGDIYAETNVEWLFLSYAQFQKIPYYEQEQIYSNILGKYKPVEYTLKKRYKIESLKF
jgi:hypothetical protein